MVKSHLPRNYWSEEAGQVSTVLNVINNGQTLWLYQTANWWQVGLNFVVPHFVSSYSAARNEAQGSGQE